MPPVLEVKNLSFSYGRERVLEDIELRLGEREFLGIIGPNGAGKSTLLKLLLGLLKPQRGSVSLFGKPPARVRDRIGYVPQHTSGDLRFPITALEVVLMGRLSRQKLFRFFSSQDKKKALEALEWVGLRDLHHHTIGTLSGGQRQRVFLARALASEARLLVLDEPLTSVDTPTEFEFYGLLKKINKHMPILLVSHDVGVVPNFVKKIVCLNRRLFHYDSKEAALKDMDHVYGCSIEMIAHGVPHRVLGKHGKKK